MNKTKLSIVLDDALPKETIIKKKQVILDGTLTHLSKERKKSKFLNKNKFCSDDCPKDYFKTENRWTQKTIC
jgi:hypothetical protein